MPYFALLAVVWAIWFVQGWRSQQYGLAFTWGVASSSATEELRPTFTGEEVEDEVTGHAKGEEGPFTPPLTSPLTLRERVHSHLS